MSSASARCVPRQRPCAWETQRLRGAAERLQALSPLAVLERGYSITRRVDDGSVVRDAAALAAATRCS